MKSSQAIAVLMLAAIYSPSLSVRIIETNSFRQDSGPREPEQSYRQQKLVESLGIFQSEPKYIDSSEIRPDAGTKGPFYPIQFPEPIQYDQSNAIRYEAIERPGGNTETSLAISGDIGDTLEDVSSSYISPLMSLGYRRPLKPLISRTRDIEIYTQGAGPSSDVSPRGDQGVTSAERPYSGESVDIEMFDPPSEVVYSDNKSGENHPGKIVLKITHRWQCSAIKINSLNSPVLLHKLHFEYCKHFLNKIKKFFFFKNIQKRVTFKFQLPT